MLFLCLLGVTVIYLWTAWRAALGIGSWPGQPSGDAFLSEHPESVNAQHKRQQERIAQLQQEIEELSRANTALEQDRQKAEAAREREERDTAFYRELAGKVLEGELKVPGTLAEAAVSNGRLMAKITMLNKKWGDTVPPEGTPEAAAYNKDREEVIADTASMMKFLGDESHVSEITSNPDSVRQFQSLSIYGALNLSEDQWRGIDLTLSGFYTNGFANRLNTGARPQTGIDAWNQQRAALSRAAFSAVSSRLTPEQAARFEELYSKDNWLWTISTGM